MALEIIRVTASTGLGEILTDPAYSNQILEFTCPQIGSYPPDLELSGQSDRATALAVIHHNLHPLWKNWLLSQGVSVFRDRNCLPQNLVDQQKAFRAHDSIDVAKVGRVNTVFYDFGSKSSLIHAVSRHSGTMRVLPWQWLSQHPQGCFAVLGSGPGNPTDYDMILPDLKNLLLKGPVLGVCLGHQLLARAIGLETERMPQSLHGTHTPSYDLWHKRACIVSRNHCYRVKNSPLPPGWNWRFHTLPDRLGDGLMHEQGGHLSVQFHPEGNPGPRDADYLFHEFFQNRHVCN